MNLAHCTSPIGYDLWQRNSNGISHIDSDETDTKSSAEDTSQHQRYQQEPFISSVLLYNHPSSNYAYKNGQERKPVWHYWNKTLFFHMVFDGFLCDLKLNFHQAFFWSLLTLISPLI